MKLPVENEPTTASATQSTTTPAPTPQLWPTMNIAATGADAPAGAVTLSVAMIVKDEAHQLGPLLTKLKKFADEIVVVDTGSKDNTKAIATKAGAKVVDFTWIDDFAAARNCAFANCSKDWIMWIDADDKVPNETVKAIKALKRELTTEKFKDTRTVFAPYHYEYTDKGELCVNLNRERFLKNHIGHRWVGRIHETLENPWEKSIRIENIIIEHRPPKLNQDRKSGRNLRIFELYIDIETCTLRELFLYGSELLQAQRLTDAIAAFNTYLRRSGGKPDPVGELYTVMVKLADAYHQNKQVTEGIKTAIAGIAMDPTRAECYSVAGVLYMLAGNSLAAFPMLMAATMCGLPPPHISLVVHKLYTDVPIQAMVQCARDLSKSTAPLMRAYAIGAVLQNAAAELLKAKAVLE